MSIVAELRVARTATMDVPKTLRGLLGALLEALELDAARRGDIVLAVGEVLANAVEHAYAGDRETGQVEMTVRSGAGVVRIEIADSGSFIERDGTPGRGFGLRIVRSIARDVAIEHSEGTRVVMTFDVAVGALT